MGKKETTSKANGKTYEVRKFPAKPRGKYIIKTRKHLTAIVNGTHLDSWNCGPWRANSYYEKS